MHEPFSFENDPINAHFSFFQTFGARIVSFLNCGEGVELVGRGEEGRKGCMVGGKRLASIDNGLFKN